MKLMIKKTETWKFNELSKESKAKALERHYDINVDHAWWDFTYEDAKNADIKIVCFELAPHTSCELEIDSAIVTAEYIVANHGEECDTHRASVQFIKDRDAIEQHVQEDEEFQWTDIYQSEHENIIDEYLTSDEAIKDMLINNEYDLTIDGCIY